MTQFLHKKADSSVWFYRRRFPKEVADAIGKQMFMQSLKTTVKRDAERLSRQVSVQFDTICREALIARDLVKINVSSGLEGEGALTSNSKRAAEAILDGIPNLIRLAATQVVQEQQRNPAGWQDVVRRWRDFYEAMKLGRVPVQALIPVSYTHLTLPTKA